MREFWNGVQVVFTAIGGWLGWFLGGCDGLLYSSCVSNSLRDLRYL